jgi:hypothetical protein
MDGLVQTLSFSKKGPKLPKNWKQQKDKDGTITYINSVTKRVQSEVPLPLKPNWKEAVAESGAVYYYNKQTRESTFDRPQADPDDNEEAEESTREEEDGFVGRALSFMTGKDKKKGGDDMDRTSSSLKTKSFRPSKKKDAEPEKKPELKKQMTKPAVEQKTVFISCSMLIKEVKLCVGEEHQQELDTLYEKLTSQQIAAEQGVKQLMEMVGSTIVQQAGLSVMNSQKGLLPHGWLEYTDEASGRPYYYNVHTKITTWYKPQTGPMEMLKRATSSIHTATGGEERDKAEPGMVALDCHLETHVVAITGFL